MSMASAETRWAPALRISFSTRAFAKLPFIFHTFGFIFLQLRSLILSGRSKFYVLTLNCRNVILSEELCALGTVNSVHVNPSEVLRQAVLRSAASIICLHNHPSGDPSPSAEDRALTDRISRAASLMGVRLLDHIIITPRSFYSFSDAGGLA